MRGLRVTKVSLPRGVHKEFDQYEFHEFTCKAPKSRDRTPRTFLK